MNQTNLFRRRRANMAQRHHKYFADETKTRTQELGCLQILLMTSGAYQWSAKLNDNNTVFQAELTALHEAVYDCATHLPKPQIPLKYIDTMSIQYSVQ
ncbi:hypothetical protein AVEN_252647-1 [Araneus ventricosus]|uniref:Uncharacterized protein n=1 Tax=Araneus ventricosus TaxID=182803 RepID=A0A4Y2RGE1_ARAVE|nr:hypothetical protein AVEN_252646-1 [Araneus ventricosus]GBN74848.1 hypothetical protein AVEN_252647-1 [Araneus ventricosus]